MTIQQPGAEWPADHLEDAPKCPICREEKRKLLHENLTDTTFGVAAGIWNLWKCSTCGSGWLDPRPDEQTIGLAYERYYTHDTSTETFVPEQNFRHKLGNDYRNWRFGADMKPSVAIGRYVARLFPFISHNIDESFRFLPRRASGETKRLLDIGCGTGAFLEHASSVGWTGAGVEPDETARAMAVRRGFDVRSKLSEFNSGRTQFDAITLSHVIEHMHDPCSTLLEVNRMLSQDGLLYIATPNLDGVGHHLYGRNWRGLEAPRHLTLFTYESFKKSLCEAGFGSICFHNCGGAFGFTSLQSRRIAAGEDPYDEKAQLSGPIADERSAKVADSKGVRAEFLVVTATKL